MSAQDKLYKVRAAHCDHTADDETIYEMIRRITDPLDRSWQRLSAARKIGIKVNLVWYPDRLRSTAGRLQELVDPAVFRAVLRLLRERTTAEIVVADTTLMHDNPGADVHFKPLLEEFGVTYVECSDEPSAEFEVPGGGCLFDRYYLHPVLKEADEMISLATLKTHAFMGVTLCTKNLFGLCPIHPRNRPRSYFHHLVRMPYFLPDLGKLLHPALNLIDGLVAQTRREWGGEARVTDTLVAGDHVIATDICAATLMGHDPYDDWPNPPFRRDRNHLKIAAESGFGPQSLDEVDYQHDCTPPVGEFDSDQTDSDHTVHSWRSSMCEQALDYEANHERYESEFAGEYIYLQDGVVLHHSENPYRGFSRRQMSGAKPDRAIWLKYVDPDEWEGEHFEIYRRELARVGELV